MKKLLVAIAIMTSLSAGAQADTLKTNTLKSDMLKNDTLGADTLRAGVYNWSRLPVRKSGGRESRQILQGNTTDLNSLKIHTSTLGPGQTNHPLQAYHDREELIVVRDGQLKVTINDSSKILGAGSVVLIVAGDQQSFQNVSDQPVTYCVLAFKGKAPVNIKRGQEHGGSLMKDWKELTVKQTNKGVSRPIFDRPTSMFQRFEIHATTLNGGFESHPPHTHREEEIILLMQGDVVTNIAGMPYAAVPGDVILLTTNVPHNLKNTGEGQCWYLAMKWEL